MTLWFCYLGQYKTLNKNQNKNKNNAYIESKYTFELGVLFVRSFVRYGVWWWLEKNVKAHLLSNWATVILDLSMETYVIIGSSYIVDLGIGYCAFAESRTLWVISCERLYDSVLLLMPVHAMWCQVILRTLQCGDPCCFLWYSQVSIPLDLQTTPLVSIVSSESASIIASTSVLASVNVCHQYQPVKTPKINLSKHLLLQTTHKISQTGHLTTLGSH